MTGYDVYRRHVVLCIVVAMISMDVMHDPNYCVVGIMPVMYANLYILLVGFSGYF
jgi:hypothetical protein